MTTKISLLKTALCRYYFNYLRKLEFHNLNCISWKFCVISSTMRLWKMIPDSLKLSLLQSTTSSLLLFTLLYSSLLLFAPLHSSLLSSLLFFILLYSTLLSSLLLFTLFFFNPLYSTLLSSLLLFTLLYSLLYASLLFFTLLCSSMPFFFGGGSSTALRTVFSSPQNFSARVVHSVIFPFFFWIFFLLVFFSRLRSVLVASRCTCAFIHFPFQGIQNGEFREANASELRI